MEWEGSKMYNIGYCKICKQGLLEIAQDKLTKKIFICCDECEAEWDNPEDSSMTIFISRCNDIVEKLAVSNPLVEDLEEYNKN